METCSKRISILIIAAIFICIFAQSPAFSIEYVIVDLGTLGGTRSEAKGINNRDEVVGTSCLAGDTIYHAFPDSGGIMTDLGVPGTSDPFGASSACCINDSGQVAVNLGGWSALDRGRRAFLYSGGVMEDLGIGIAEGINNLGHVVVTAYNAPYNAGNVHAFWTEPLGVDRMC